MAWNISFTSLYGRFRWGVWLYFARHHAPRLNGRALAPTTQVPQSNYRNRVVSLIKLSEPGRSRDQITSRFSPLSLYILVGTKEGGQIKLLFELTEVKITSVVKLLFTTISLNNRIF